MKSRIARGGPASKLALLPVLLSAGAIATAGSGSKVEATALRKPPVVSGAKPLSKTQKVTVVGGHRYIVRGSDGYLWYAHHHRSQRHAHHGVYEDRQGRLVYKEDDGRWYLVPPDAIIEGRP